MKAFNYIRSYSVC